MRSNDIISFSKIKNKFLGKIKNINYEAKNVDIFKSDTTSELFGAIGFYLKLIFKKETIKITTF